MQIEILKRDKIDYVFQSLSIISIVPVLGLEPLKNWAVENFSFTQSFYCGKNGMLVQILVILLTIICYLLLRKIKKIMDQQIKAHKIRKILGRQRYTKIQLERKLWIYLYLKKEQKSFLKVQKAIKRLSFKIKDGMAVCK